MTDDQWVAYVQRGDPDRFRTYIALKHLRAALWAHFPLFVFARWATPRLDNILTRKATK